MKGIHSPESEYQQKPDVFFQEILELFSAAEKAVGGIEEHHYLIGSHRVTLKFAGPGLTSYITPSFSHLKTSPTSNPDLTIYLWDSISTGVNPPVAPWTPEDYREHGLIRGYNNQRFLTQYQTALHILNLKENLAVYWIQDVKNTPIYHTITPLRNILNWWMGKQEKFIIHAAAVGYPENGVIITGRGGAGKSTTALSCLDSSLNYVGDDYCLLSISPQPFVHSLYCSGTLEAEDVDKFPRLRSSLHNPTRLTEEKAVYLLHNRYEDQLIEGFPIRAVLVPKVTGRSETSIQPISSAQTLLALAPGSIFQLPGVKTRSFHAMADLIRETPCYSLELGEDLEKIPQVLENFLEGKR